MARPVTWWFRLYRGRVWHLRLTDAVYALCGQPQAPGEDQPDRPPFGGRPCPYCFQAAGALVESISIALEEYSRRQSAETSPSEPVCQRCDHLISAHNDDDGCQGSDDLGDACECHQAV